MESAFIERERKEQSSFVEINVEVEARFYRKMCKIEILTYMFVILMQMFAKCACGKYNFIHTL